MGSTEAWVDIGAPKKRREVSTMRKEEGNMLQRENIQNASHLQKPHG